MSDKPVAGLVTATLVAPLVVVCCLAPAAVVAGTGWLFGWLGGAGVGTSMAVAAGLFVALMLLLGRRRRATARRANESRSA